MALDMKTGKLSVIASLDHVNILTNDVEACRRFYVDGLGFEEGFRPAFKQPGLWLYIGSTPVVHIIETDAPLPKHNGTIDGEVRFGVTESGAVDHIAFRALSFDKFTARLDDHGIKWQDREIPGMDLHQLFCFDPHGVKVEFNFEGQDRPWKTLQKTHKEVLTARAKNKAKSRKKVKVLA